MFLKASIVCLSLVPLAPQRAKPEPAAPAPAAALVAEVERSPARNAVFIETFGNGGLYSLNYEHRLPLGVGLRVGVSYLALATSAGAARGSASVMSAPLLLTFGKENTSGHGVEVGAGATLFSFAGEARTFVASANVSEVLPVATAAVGYRYAPRDGRLLLRLAFTPFVAFVERPVFVPWGGMSVGGRM